MDVYVCPERDFEVRVNPGDPLPDEAKLCPGHDRPVRKVEHPVGQCTDFEDIDPFGNRTRRCLHEAGLLAYEAAE